MSVTTGRDDSICADRIGYKHGCSDRQNYKADVPGQDEQKQERLVYQRDEMYDTKIAK